MKKHYNLPGLWERKKILIPLLSLYKNNIELFYDDIKIDAVFGNFSHLIWDGGRTDFNIEYAYLEDIIKIQEIYNKILNISMRFVCSNQFIQKQDCLDKFGNLILSLCENSQNSIILGSHYLEEYIKDKYPKYNFISSTTKCLNNNEEIIHELSKHYSYVCLPYTKNYDINFLQQIPIELKSKVELLINEKCNIYCPYRKQHYIEISKSNYLYDSFYANNIQCISEVNTLQEIQQNSIIPYTDLNKYINIGINHFKLEGRVIPGVFTELQDILTYCIKPEWQNFVFRNLESWISNFNLNNYKLDNYKLS